MKNFIYLIIITLLISCTTNHSENTDKLLNSNYSVLSISDVIGINLESIGIPTQNEIDIIFFILQNTREINIHQMRGETENQVLVNNDGREAVYDKNGDIVSNPYNKGSFNNYNYKTEPIKKFLVDTLPWLEWGNDPIDPTSKDERFYYYTLDLNVGIQTYIFEGRKSNIKSIDISDFSNDELETLKLFKYIIFNDVYNINLVEDNLDMLENDGNFYWSYFYQIHDLFGIRQE